MIRKLSLILLFTFLPLSVVYSQTTVFGYVKDQEGKPIENVEVDLLEIPDNQRTDKIGYFQFVDLQPGDYHMTIIRPTFETTNLNFTITAGERRKDLGEITMAFAPIVSDAGVVLIDDAVADDDGSSMQPTVGLLGAGRDAFDNVAAFQLGGFWFRPRGIDNRYEDILFNGVPMSKNDDGRVNFGNWGGLNDVTRYPYEYANNLTPSEYAFGNLGGVVYYNTRASSYRKGVSLTYSRANRSYFNRVMGTYSSGLTSNGWAYTVSGSRRWADEGVIEGTYQDSYAYFAAIEKKFSDRFSMNLTAFGAPTYRASNSPNTQEAYDIMGKDYNSYWGWQDGEKRNSRIRNTFEPVFQLSLYNKVGKNSNWNNTFSYQTGSDARSRLDWYQGRDPNPTYYRYLPSYGNFTIEEFKQRAQINWDEIYSINRNNLVDHVGNSRQAVYTIVEDVNDDDTFNFVSHFDTNLTDFWKLNINFNYQKLWSDNYRRLKDLLGANYAVNLDAFGNGQPYDLDADSDKVYEGDRTQYSFDLLRDQYTLNVSSELNLDRWTFVGSIFASYSESQRDGKFRNHFYENNSKGKSAVYDAFNTGLKAQVTYKLDGKNFLTYSGTLFSLAPSLNEIFINPRVNDFVTPGVDNQIINSNELTYTLRGQALKIRLSGYHTTVNNATEISRYYAEGIQIGDLGFSNNAFVAEILSGIDKKYKGVELGVDVKITPTLNAIGVASIGDYTIENNPDTFISIDSDLYAQGFESLGKANLKDYKIAGTPQKAYSFGLRYNSPKFWWLGASANYLADQYLDFSALNRTENFYTNPATGDPYENLDPETLARLLAQTKFDDQFMLNANAGKSFMFGKYRLGISLSVNNILNNRDYVTGGFEQGRKSNYNAAIEESERAIPFFGPKLWYDRGTNFFANVYLRF